MAKPYTQMKNPGDDHQYFNWRQVATALLKEADIHEGWWRIGMQFDAHGAAVKVPVTKIQFQLVPAAFLSIVNINLKPVPEDQVDELCVNAAVANPKSRILTPGAHPVWPVN